MNNGNKIVVIADNTTIKEKLLSKINLVRSSDVIKTYTCSNIVNMTSESMPALIIIYAGMYNTNWQETISEIKNFPEYSSVPILLVCEKIEQDFLLNAFDEGVSDYIPFDASDTEFLVRIIWNLQKSNLIKKHNNNIRQLEELDVIFPQTYFYKNDFVNTIFENTIKNHIESGRTTSLMILTPDIDCKQKLSVALLSNIIKDTIRNTDLTGIKDDNKFYILMQDTSAKQTEVLFNRIRDEIVPDYTISAGAVETVTDFESAEVQAKTVLQDALTQKDKLIIYTQNIKKITNEEYTSDMSTPHKNFKLFKLSFMKKLNNVITPVFYQFQKMYEEKLFETRIEQIASEGESRFELTAPNIKSKLVINYPGFSKINISTKHITKKGTKENTISLNLPELDSAELNKILDMFIQEYREISDN